MSNETLRQSDSMPDAPPSEVDSVFSILPTPKRQKIHPIVSLGSSVELGLHRMSEGMVLAAKEMSKSMSPANDQLLMELNMQWSNQPKHL